MPSAKRIHTMCIMSNSSYALLKQHSSSPSLAARSSKCITKAADVWDAKNQNTFSNHLSFVVSSSSLRLHEKLSAYVNAVFAQDLFHHVCGPFRNN